MRRTLLLVFALCCFAPIAHAAQGVNLRWDACLGGGGAFNKSFACDTNAGSEQLYVSFELDSTLASIKDLECNLWYSTAIGTPGSWWQFKNVGTCRRNALTLTASNPAPGEACADWATVPALGTFVSVIPNYSGSGLTRLMLVSSSASTATLVPGQEYFALRLTISHASTVGTAACGGCTTPVCLGVEGLYLTDSGGRRHDIATETAHLSSVASWQGSSPSSYFIHTTGATPSQNRDLRILECAAAVPTRNHTWGAIKSLYQ